MGRFRGAVALTAAAMLVGCSPSSPPSAAPAGSATTGTSRASSAATTAATSAQPTTSPTDVAGAVAAAVEKQGRFSAADFAGEWLLFTKELRNNITQDAWVTYSETCSAPAKSGAGLVPTVAGSRLDGPGRAIVRFELMGVTKAVTMVYEDGGWYKEPDDFLRANYGKTGDELIAAEKTEGNCKS